MTLVSRVLSDARRYIMNTTRDRYNQLSAPITSTDGTFTASLAMTGIAQGAVVEVDLEQMLVSTDPTGNVVTVLRGFNGTTPVAHAAAAMVRVNPVVFDSDLFLHLNGELDDLSAPFNGLYQVKTIDITYDPSRLGYDLGDSAAVVKILQVRYADTFVARGYPEVENVSFQSNLINSDFPSGNVMFLPEGMAGQPVTVMYGAEFDHVTAVNQHVESSAGFPAQAVDILAMGVAIRATVGREIARNFMDNQGDSRRATEVPAGANANASRPLERLRDRRIKAERSRLRTNWETKLL